MNEIITIMSLSVPVILTGIFALYYKLNKSVFKLVLAFSAAYLFSTTIMHLLPEVYTGSNFKFVGLFIVLGFSIQLIIENFSTGLEHGHSHIHSDVCKKHFPYGIIFGLFIHSFLEGLPVYHASKTETVYFENSDLQLIFGLVIHNIPISFLFVALLKEHLAKTFRIIILLILFSLMAPAGYLFSYFLHNFEYTTLINYQFIADALVIGIFLHISTAILFETGDEHRYTWSKVLSMLTGIIFAYLLS